MDLSPFFDLIAVHELAHEVHAQMPYRFPRLWLEEVFCNLCLHAYVAEIEPAQLPVLETLPPAFAALDPAQFPYRSLAAFEALYNEVGPVAYGWYQCQFHLATKRSYDTGGVAALRRLWDTFVLGDARLVSLLTAVQPELAVVLTDWGHAAD
jgi:hypothetical protein